MKPEQKKTALKRIVSVAGIILCVIFGFMLVCNLTIILKGTMNPDRPPSVFGITPMVVQSGSMSGDAPDHIEVGDLIFTGKADGKDVCILPQTDKFSWIKHRAI